MKDKKTVWRIQGPAKLLLGAGILCIGLLLFSFDSFAVEGKVKPRSAKIREEANTTSVALASVEAGDELSIKGKVTGTDGDEWYQVFVNADTLGFIRSDLVEPEGTVSEIQLASAAPAEESVELAAQTDGGGAGENQESSGVEPMQNQNANVTGGDVNVRAAAGTNSNKVAKAPNGTALIVSGKATGADGKIWYQVSLTVDGNEVSGFIRSDYVTLGDVIPEPEPEPTPEPEQTPEQTPDTQPSQAETKQYDTVQETKEDGTTEWYLYDMHDADREKWLKYPIPRLLEAAQEYEASGNSVGQQKIIIIVMGVIIILLALGITLLFFKLKDASFEDDEDDEDDNFEEAVPVRRKRPVSDGEPVRRTVSEGGRPVRRPVSEGDRPVRRPVSEGDRPVRRPVSEGDRPVRRTVSEGDRPVRRPAAEGQQRPKQAGKPAQKGTRPYEGEPVRRQAPQGTRQRVPAPRPSEREAVYEDEPEMNERNEQNGAWRSKNFMSEDDEFEFEFLNMDDPNRL